MFNLCDRWIFSVGVCKFSTVACGRLPVDGSYFAGLRSGAGRVRYILFAQNKGVA